MWHQDFWDENGVYNSETTNMPRNWIKNGNQEHFVTIGHWTDDFVWWFHVKEPCTYGHYRVILFRWSS